MNGWMDRIGRDWMMDGMGRDEIDEWMDEWDEEILDGWNE